MDGVLFPFSTACFERINRKYDYDFGEVEFWARKNRSNRFYGKHREEIERIVADPRIYIDPPVHNVVKEVLWTLAREYGNEIFYITARAPHLQPATELWLADLPNAENLYMGMEYKTYLIRDLELDFYTDDRESIIRDVLENEPDVDSRLYWADYMSYDKFINSGLPLLYHVKQLLGE